MTGVRYTDGTVSPMFRPVTATGSAPSLEMVRAQLARILASPAFEANPRASAFLAFVVGEALRGRADEIKQATIGCEVFGRPATYDPKRDPIVRSVARVVREKLNDYYLAEGWPTLSGSKFPRAATCQRSCGATRVR